MNPLSRPKSRTLKGKEPLGPAEASGVRGVHVCLWSGSRGHLVACRSVLSDASPAAPGQPPCWALTHQLSPGLGTAVCLPLQACCPWPSWAVGRWQPLAQVWTGSSLL